MINAYKVLGLRNFATRKEILIAYRNLSKKYHPDLNQGDKFYEEKFKEIQAAYAVLSNFGQHMELDTFLRKQIEAEKVTNEPPFSTEPLQNKQTQQTEVQPEEKKIHSSFLDKKFLKTALYTFVTICVTGITFFWLVDYVKRGNALTTDGKINTSSTLIEPILNKPINELSIATKDYTESGKYFTIYSTKQEVVKVQGEPSDSIEVSTLKQEIWYYDLSSVTFEDNRVVEYANIGDNLRISYFNTHAGISPKPAFSIGSTRLDVIAAQGNPTTTMRIKPLNQEIWHYGGSRITFVRGRVNEYVNSEQNLRISHSGNLKAKTRRRSNDSSAIGSNRNEVLRAQNPPGITKMNALNKENHQYGGNQITLKSARTGL